MSDPAPASGRSVIRTPDQRLRVFVSSTLQELADERAAARDAIVRLRLTPVMFEQGARPHPPRDLYRAYIEQSHIFIGIYGTRYGWIAPGADISGLEDECRLARDKPNLIYVKSPAPARELRLTDLLDRLEREGRASYRLFSTAAELRDLIENDLAALLSERFEQAPAAAATSGALHGRRSNLPVPRNPFIGRRQEMAEARSLLLRDDVALVTLTGPGGSGKSRLGLQIALDLIDQFKHGVFLVPLASIRDPDLVPSAIAEALDVRETTGGQPLIENLKDFLRTKQMLLLLDNFEHLLPAAPMVGALLETNPRLKCLATSRIRLRVRGERELQVPPLPVPDVAHSRGAVSLAQCPSVELFVQRAASVAAHFRLTDENADAIAEVCRRLDGLPLALELAAARIKVLPPHMLRTRLESRFTTLRGGTRDLPERHRTLQSAITWSYDLLHDSTRLLFRRAAVFVGGWTMAAADAVCNFDGRLLVLDDTETLVDSSLLIPLADGAGEPRFGMLETIREYALERLRESGEDGTTCERHASFFLRKAEEAAPRMTTGRRDVWLARLEIEHDNLRAALAWSRREADDRQIGLRLAAALGWFWYLRGHFTEGRAWLEEMLARSRPAGRTAARAAALLSDGALAWTQGDFAAAQALLDQCVAICRETGRAGRRWLAPALTQLGYVLAWQGNSAAARPMFEEGLSLARQMADAWVEAFALRGMGDVTVTSGDTLTAWPIYEESLRLFRALSDPWGVAIVLGPMGRIALARGDCEKAQALHEEALALLRRTGDRWNVAGQLACLAYVALCQGNRERSKALLEESLALWCEMGNRAGVAVSLAGFAALAATAAPVPPEGADRESLSRSARLLGAAEILSEATGFRLHPLERVEFDRNVARARAALGEEAFRVAWAAGRSMTLDQAAAYATSAGAG